MKLSEAPRPGWYPDPEGRTRLRWWDGGDWSDRYRTRPATTPDAPGAANATSAGLDPAWSTNVTDLPPVAAAVVDQVRMAARQEAALAAEEFTRRAREVTGYIPPLISQYTNKFMRYLRIGLAIAFVLLVIWIAYQLWVQKSIFDWIGDRIDNLTDENASVLTWVLTLSRW